MLDAIGDQAKRERRRLDPGFAFCRAMGEDAWQDPELHRSTDRLPCVRSQF
jgi:hypothetical protein